MAGLVGSQVDFDQYLAFRAKLAAVDRKMAGRLRKRMRLALAQHSRDLVAEGAESMPSSGGLREHLEADGKAAASMLGKGVRLRLSSKTAGLLALDAGRLRHPTYGHRPWVDQPVTAGSWSDAFQRLAPEIRDAVGREVNAMLEELG